jgi:hypothetical protein
MLAQQENGHFLASYLSEDELPKIKEATYSELAAEAFEALAKHLREKGNDEEFNELRADYSRKILAFWALKRREYNQAVREKRIIRGQTLVKDNGESLTLVNTVGKSDNPIIKITSETPMEVNKIVIHVERGRVLFNANAPFVISDIKSSPEVKRPTVGYKFYFLDTLLDKIAKTDLYPKPSGDINLRDARREEEIRMPVPTVNIFAAGTTRL